MTALFALAALVQINDPDPLRWVAVYGIAAAISARAALTPRVPRRAALLLAIAALVWAAVIAATGPAPADYRRMFEAWEMRSAPIEEAREATGLIVVAAWMLVVGGRRGRGPQRSTRP